MQLREIIDPLYAEYSAQIQELNLDIPDPTLAVANADLVRFVLAKYFTYLVRHREQGIVTLSVTTSKPDAGSAATHHLVLHDANTTLDATDIQQFSQDGVSVKSRFGFGTTLIIPL